MRGTTLNDVCEQHGLKDIAFLKMNIEARSTMHCLGWGRHQICAACHDFRFDSGEGEQFCVLGFVEQFLIGRVVTLATS